jgi:hypothetical protein
MKTLLYTLAICFVFASCNFGGEGNEQPIVTEKSDTTIPAKVDETRVNDPAELPIAKLSDTKQEEVASLELIVTTTPGMKVEDLETFLLVCDSEVVKDAKCFTMLEFKGIPITDGMTKVKLNGRPFHYEQVFNGNIFKLMGFLKLGSKWYRINAEDADPTWIFPYLAVMEPKASV